MTNDEAIERFEEILERVKHGEHIYVEKEGAPEAVILSVQEYNLLRHAASEEQDWRKALEEARNVGAQINARRHAAPLPDPSEVLRALREERDAQLTDLY